MRNICSKYLFFLLLFLWFIIDLIQISTTGIVHDEAYYYTWGQHLDWGYFDHPPMVAVLTYLGDLFFDSTWSVRFFTVLLHAFTVLFIWKTIDAKYKQTRYTVLYFFAIAFSLPMFSVYGFLTAPDSALLFFFSLFTLYYKYFLSRRKILDIIWLAISIAGMILSKYHAFLIIFLVFIANWQIIKDKRFWFLTVLVMLFVMPHFIWLYKNDFIAINYHLIKRSHGFKLKYILEFIPGQFGVFNPFYLSLFLILIFRKFYQQNLFVKSLRFISVGFLVFFTFMTLKGRVEPHWTVIVSIPLLIMVFPYVLRLSHKFRYVKYVVGVFVLLTFLARILIATDNFIGVTFNNDEVKYYDKMNAFVEGKPIVFIGSFQRPSTYYYANPNSKIATVPYFRKRKTQFDIWKWYKKYVGTPVFISAGRFNNPTKYSYNDTVFKGWFVDYYQDNRLINIEYDINTTSLKRGEKYPITLNIVNTSAVDYNFKSLDMPLDIKVAFVGDDPIKAKFYKLPLQNLSVLKAGKHKTISTTFKVPQKLNNQFYKLTVSIYSKVGHTTNSKDTLVEIIK